MLSNTGKHQEEKKKTIFTQFSIVCIKTNRALSRGTQLTWFEVDLAWFWNLSGFDFVLNLKDGIKWEKCASITEYWKKLKCQWALAQMISPLLVRARPMNPKTLPSILWSFFEPFFILSSIFGVLGF